MFFKDKIKNIFYLFYIFHLTEFIIFNKFYFVPNVTTLSIAFYYNLKKLPSF